MNDVNISTELDAEGILLARIDMPNRAMNVFSRDLMDALEALITRAQGDEAIRAVVLTSGKPSFLAGADLAMVEAFTERAASTGSPEELHALLGHLGRLFRRLETHPTPFVAAINGLALGGGLELCLACRARIVADDPAIQLGLPEVTLGLLPGVFRQSLIASGEAREAELRIDDLADGFLLGNGLRLMMNARLKA